jgi:GTA TIM-barrel-like domain/Putative phage tail protein/Terminase large subunit, T4likevirus-type, N-terminal
LKSSGVTSGAALIAFEPPQTQKSFLEALRRDELRALPYLFEFWALPHQLPPGGAWKTWVILGGRGAGKTRAGSEWVRAQVEGAGPVDAGQVRRIALIGETFDQARDVMVFGESGILACSPPDRTPRWEAARRRLIWPNGAIAQVYSARDFEGLRGPQFDAAWVDEIGCAAIDKGTNQPNRFLDPKSSESGLPKYSNGARDDLIQMQYLRAVSEYWNDGENNPVSEVYGGPMVDPARMFVWAWDARPYPFFPANSEVWSDGANYATGHWLTGRVSARALAGVVEEICAGAGVNDVDTGGLYGVVRGYSVDGGLDPRQVLQPLLLAQGVDAIERDGRLVFRNRDGRVSRTIDQDGLARGEGVALVTRTRAPEAETSGRVRLNFIEADGDYEARASEGVFPDERTVGVAQSELPLALTSGEATGIVERWLAEARVARDVATFALPPSMQVAAGDVVTIGSGEGSEKYRVDRIEDAGMKLVEAVRIEPTLYQRNAGDETIAAPRPLVAPMPVWARVLDLPLLRGDEDPAAPWIVASSSPWPGSVAVYSSVDGASWEYDLTLGRNAVMGETLVPLASAKAGLWDRGPALDVRLVQGALASIDDTALFAGGNTAVIAAPAGGDWEVFQFRDAELIAPDVWSLSHRLRGQRGTDALMPGSWPVGSTIVVLDGALGQLPLSPEMRGLPRHYRVGPAARPVDHPSFVEFTHQGQAAGLRPYAPTHLSIVGEGDKVFRWIRRTRIGGDGWDGPEVPVGEAAEAYLVRVIVAGTTRREESVTAPEWTYSAAMRTADAVAGPYSVEVAQISDLFGPGLFTRMDVND